MSEQSSSGDGAPDVPLRIAGQNLIEFQARALHQCSARHILILVDRVPADLVAAFDRLRAEGIGIEIARDARDAADRIHPDEQLILMASGVVANPSWLNDVANTEAATIFTFADSPETEHFERIDRDRRWSGVAVMPGANVRETIGLLGDWSLGPTLLRIALQKGSDCRAVEPEGCVLLASNAEQARAATRAFAGQSELDGEIGFTDRRLIGPLAGRGATEVMAAGLPFALAEVLGPVLMGSALLLGYLGLSAASFAAFFLALLTIDLTRRFAATAMRRSNLLAWQGHAARLMLVALTLLLVWANPGSVWVLLVMALWFAAGLFLDETGPISAGSGDFSVLLFVCTVLGQPVVALALAIGWQLAARIHRRWRDTLVSP